MADTNLSALIWSVADLLRGDFKQSEYGKVILQALLEEQRAWIRYKDSSCNHWQHGYGREGQVIDFYGCRIAVIKERERHLREQFLRPEPRKNER